MSLHRREFLARTAGVLAGATLPSACDLSAAEDQSSFSIEPLDWDAVRAQFALSPDYIHMSAMLLASHPAMVRAAIERHRRGLDANPVAYLEDNNGTLREAVRVAAGRYVGVQADSIALTDSTTMGIGILYNGLRLQPGQEILSTDQDYFVTYEAIRLAALRSGATARRISLYEDIEGITAESIVSRILEGVRPATRVLGLTWVHSSTGLKLPMRRIADALAEINRTRVEADQVLLVVDGVHGFGNQDETLTDLGCDFFIAGCHKWLFGPRGTGIIAAGPRGWIANLPTIPSFIDDQAWAAWQSGSEGPNGASSGDAMTPGGFKAYEHQWSLVEAFQFHDQIRKSAVASRTRELVDQLKVGLQAMPHIRLLTPMDEELSAGIVSFDADGYSPQNLVRALRERRVIASVAPYAVPHARLTPSIINTPGEIDLTLAELRALG